jgi:hypothetical protein
MLSPSEKQDLDKIQRCLRSEDGKVLMVKLIEYYKRSDSQLKSARDTVDIYRYQGHLEALANVLKLEED